MNIDCVSREGQVPDLICDVLNGPLPYDSGTVDVIVLSQVYEHFHLSEGLPVLTECHRVLKEGGRLFITVPNIRALVNRWLARQISDYIFLVNVYGAWQNEPGDDHHWAWSAETLMDELRQAGKWHDINTVGKCDLPGSDLAFDWWILGMRATK